MSETVNTLPETEETESGREVVFEEALEAILFAAGHPVTYATLARVLNMTPMKVKAAAMAYAEAYNAREGLKRGVMLLTYEDSCQLCTKEYYLPEIRDALGIRKSGSLSTSSMEALAIVAYNQPVTRLFVDTLRRADSSYAMNNLIDRGLIEAKGRLDVPGRPMLYGTTNDFLRCFGLSDLSELPSTTDEMQAMFEKAQNSENEAAEDAAEQIDMLDAMNEGAVPETEAPAEIAPTPAEPEDETSAEDDIVADLDE